MISPLLDQILFGRPATHRAAGGPEESGPRTTVRDTAASFILAMELPGFGAEDVKVDVTREKLSITGDRKPASLEGYAAHRRERLPFNFSRSYTLPVPVDADNASATVKNGVLTVTLPKIAQVRPRTIAVTAVQ